MKIRPTRTPVLLLLFLISILVSWGTIRTVESYGGDLPEIPWSTAVLLGLVALALAFVAFDLHRKIDRPRKEKDKPVKPREVNPLHAARMVVLSKASSHGGAMITGLYLGFAWYLLPDLNSDQRKVRLVVAGVCALLGLAITVIGIVMERILRLPEE